MGVISLMILVGFSYLADPKSLHWNSAIHPLGSLIVNYLYSFVVVCPNSSASLEHRKKTQLSDERG